MIYTEGTPQQRLDFARMLFNNGVGEEAVEEWGRAHDQFYHAAEMADCAATDAAAAGDQDLADECAAFERRARKRSDAAARKSNEAQKLAELPVETEE